MFDLIPASTQYLTVPATVTNNSVMTVAMDCQPDFLPADATANYFFYLVTSSFYFRHGATANQLVGQMNGRVATYDCTALWVAGQRVHLVVEFDKAAGTIVVTLNGAVLTPSYSGSAGTAATGTLFVGANSTPANFFDGDIGNVAVWNRTLTATEKANLLLGVPAKECALSGLTYSAPWDINEKADFAPGGEEATVIGSPLISQHPLILRRGARVLVEGAQSALGAVGLFENPGWILTGTASAGTKLESVAAPAGTNPALGAQVIRYQHLDTEGGLYATKTFGATRRGYCRFYLNTTAGYSASAIHIVGTTAAQIYLRATATGLTVYRVTTGGTVNTAIAASIGRWRCVTLAWDLDAGTFKLWMGADLVINSVETLTEVPERFRFGLTGTVGTVDFYLAALDIRSDRAPDALYDGAFDLDGTADYLTAPQAVATAIQDEGAVGGWTRLDFLPAEGVYRDWFRAAQGGAAYLRFGFSSTANRIYLYNNGRSGYGASTALWGSGQWVHLFCQWKKSTDTLEIYINGTSLGALTKAGTWGADAISSVLGVGANQVGSTKLDGALGRIHVLSRLLTAAEITSLSEGRHAREVAPDAWVESWRPGSLIGEKGAYNLTKVGAPAIDQGPGVQDATGLVEVRSHFEGVGYEQPWTAAGTPTANSFIDPDAARPAGWPSWAGQPVRMKQLATENAMNISKVLSATDIDTYWHREVLYFLELPGAASQITWFYQPSLGATVYMSVSNTGSLTMSYHIAAGFQNVTLATVAVGRVYYVEIGYSLSGRWVAYRVNGHLGNKAYTYIPNVTLDRGGMRSLYLRTSTVTTYSIDMYRGAIEGRTDMVPANLFRQYRKKAWGISMQTVSNELLHTSGALNAGAAWEEVIDVTTRRGFNVKVAIYNTLPSVGLGGNIAVEISPSVEGGSGTKFAEPITYQVQPNRTQKDAIFDVPTKRAKVRVKNNTGLTISASEARITYDVED